MFDPLSTIISFSLLVVLALYLLPWLIALSRGHQSTTAIFVLVLFLGWTFLGWIIALVWSFTYVIPKPPNPADKYLGLDETQR